MFLWCKVIKHKEKTLNILYAFSDSNRESDRHHESFERRLKLSAMFLSIFWKVVSPSWFYCRNSQSNFEMTLEIFLLSIISISCIWVESSAQRFLSAVSIENSKLYPSVTAMSTLHSRKLECKFNWKQKFQLDINLSFVLVYF